MSYVAPLDQSVNDPTETEQLLETGATRQQNNNDNFNRQLNNHNDYDISDNLPIAENGEARKRNSLDQQVESDTGNWLISEMQNTVFRCTIIISHVAV